MKVATPVQEMYASDGSGVICVYVTGLQLLHHLCQNRSGQGV